MLLFVLISITNAFADNKLSIDNFSIKPGDTKEVAVNLDNSDAMTSLQMDVQLPSGLACTAVTYNQDRLDRSEQTITLTPQATTGLYRVGIFTINQTNFVGNSGALVYLTIKADADFKNKCTINILNASASDIKAANIPIPSSTAEVSPIVEAVAKISTGVASMSVKNDGVFKKIDFNLDNSIVIYGLTAEISLPQGLSMETLKSGANKFIYTDRLPSDFSISSNVLSNGKIRVLISGTSGAPISGKTGTLFSFNVKAGEGLTDNSTVTIDNVILSDANDDTYSLGQAATVDVINYTSVYAQFDTLNAAYKNAINKINAEDVNVKDTASVVNAEKAVADQIAAITKSLDKSYANVSLVSDKETLLASMAEVSVSITKMIEDAAVAEKAFVDTKTKKEANEAANTKLTAAIAAVQAKLDAAKATMAKDCKDVFSQFVPAEDVIQEKIDSITTSVKVLYDAVKLTAESTVSTADVETAITNMVADAKAAQKIHDTLTGINDVVTSDSGAQFFSVSGQKLSAPVKGAVNIVKFSNGQTKKIFVK
jgi:hypothetical protein